MSTFIEYSKIVFLISLCLFIINIIYSIFHAKREESMLRAIRIIADTGRMGEAPETSIKRVAELKNELSAFTFKRILKKMNKGKNFPDSITEVTKWTNSPVLKYVSEIIITAQQTGVEIFPIIKTYLPNLEQLRYYERYSTHSINKSIILLQIIGVVFLPTLFYFFPMFFDGEVMFDVFVFYFLMGFGILIGLIDYLIYDNWVSSLILTPLFASFIILWPTYLASITHFFV